ncbi:MAG: transketolase [Bacilli bacterium]|nr:transketolase [Bacilli bacterium]MDD4734314.1 transketolase [Bacilli bacterium]
MDEKIINNIRSLAIDMIDEAGSGHPGICLGAAPIIYTIFAKHLNYNPSDPNWINRDRFIMSAGHGSALLYSTMFMAGYGLEIEDLKKFRQFGSKTPGHPEYGVTQGVEATTGPLGQGIGIATGMALGGKILEEKYTLEKEKKIDNDKPLINYHIYVLCSDGDLMEGISYEAASFAGNLNLNNLIILYDSNNISLDGILSYSFTENVLDRFKALGWYTDVVKNGNSVNEIDNAINKAKKSGKPSIIEVKTIIGYGSIWEGTNKSHGNKLESDDITNLKTKWGLPNEKFHFDLEAKKDFSNQLTERSAIKYEIWASNYRRYVEERLDNDDSSLKYLFNNQFVNLLDYKWDFSPDLNEGTRVTNGQIINVISEMLPNFIGGSADLSSSTKTYIKNGKDIEDNKYNNKNIWFGVREHLMGSVLNGLSLSKFKPFGSTFLVFSDYMKPAIRMSALMNLPVTYIFTHDSIYVGEDGPTHQPIEQLASLRAIPNLYVYRPCDANELVGCWNSIINSNKPSALSLTRQDVKLLTESDMTKVANGAYVVRNETARLNGIIIATGSEVSLALKVASDLYTNFNIDIRVISMPCMELFLKTPLEYQKTLLPIGHKVIAIEAGSSFGLEKFVYNQNYLITIDKFGTSANAKDVLKYCEFDYDTVKEKIKGLLK